MRKGGKKGGTEKGMEEGGLLASCRLNKRRMKEMEREAAFSDNLPFFMDCNHKGLNKREQETDQRENI